MAPWERGMRCGGKPWPAALTRVGGAGFGLAIVGGEAELAPALQKDRLAALRASDGGGNEGF